MISQIFYTYSSFFLSLYQCMQQKWVSLWKSLQLQLMGGGKVARSYEFMNLTAEKARVLLTFLRLKESTILISLVTWNFGNAAQWTVFKGKVNVWFQWQSDDSDQQSPIVELLGQAWYDHTKNKRQKQFTLLPATAGETLSQLKEDPFHSIDNEEIFGSSHCRRKEERIISSNKRHEWTRGGIKKDEVCLMIWWVNIL